MHTAPRHSIIVVSAAAGILIALSGCEKKADQSAASPAKTAPVSTPTPTHWPQVHAADALSSTEALCGLCRLIDVRYKNTPQPVKLTFGASGATDAKGQVYAIGEEQWKGIVEMAAKAPEGKTYGRAVPLAAQNKSDGLGAAPRHAYEVQRESENVLVFTQIKTLND